MHRPIITLCMLLAIGGVASADPDSLLVRLSTGTALQGDTIFWHCEPAPGRADAATLQLWIDNTSTGYRWAYRYPILHGSADGELVIGREIPDGVYALNFLLQPAFFSIQGVVKDAHRRDTALSYLLIAKDKEALVRRTRLQAGRFSTAKYLFEDTALFIFSPLRAAGSNELLIDIATPLDSAFTPAAVNTQLLSIGKAQPVHPAAPGYHFAYSRGADHARQLAEVVVKSASGKQLRDFTRDHISGRFQDINELTFDGLGKPDIARATDIFSFLQAHVPGLTLQTDAESGAPEILYRNAPTSIYINEFKTEADALQSINPADVAVIKILRPGSGIAGGPGGAIALYTKIGVYETSPARRYTFPVRGYNALRTFWR